LTAIIVIAAALSGIVSSNPNACLPCHSGPNPSGGYTFVEPSFSIQSPQFVSPNSTFNIALSIQNPGKYKVLNATASISVSGQGNLNAGEQSIKPFTDIPDTGGQSSVNWTIRTKELKGDIVAAMQLNFTVHRQHLNTQGFNDNPYSLNISRPITVKTSAINLSKTEILFVKGNASSETLEIIAQSNASNITITESTNLQGLVTIAPKNVATIKAGEHLNVSLLFNGNNSLVDNGRLNFVWTDENGLIDSAFVTVRIIENPNAPTSSTSVSELVGRVTGIASFVLLLSSICLGAIKLGKDLRIFLHCVVSWCLLVLSVYHGIVLLLGPYSSMLYSTYVILGYASALMLGAVSVNGLLEKNITNIIGHRAWIWMHRIFLIATVVLAVIHGISMGKDFAFLRPS
jgi:hypothetical protein